MPKTFYDSKRIYAPKQEGENAGEFLRLVSGGTFPSRPDQTDKVLKRIWRKIGLW